MLELARKIIRNKTGASPHLVAADMRHTPYPDYSADIVIAGWNFCYQAVWGKDKWREAQSRMAFQKPPGYYGLEEQSFCWKVLEPARKRQPYPRTFKPTLTVFVRSGSDLPGFALITILNHKKRRWTIPGSFLV